MDLEAYVVGLEKALQIAHETARGRLRTSEERMKRDHDLRVHSRAYEKGDLVYILDTATVKGKCRKLSPSWKGPGKVIKKYLYRVKTKAAVMVAYHDSLKKCIVRDIALWLSRSTEKFRSPDWEATQVSQVKAGG